MKMSMMIRPAILGITAALTLGTTVKAQDNVSLGPTAGFGHTWLSNSPNSKYQPAGNVGLALVVSTETRFGFGADVKWSIEGGKSSTDNSTTTTRLDYIRVPIKAMYFFGELGNRVRPKVTLGPSLGFLVGGKQKYEISDAIQTEVDSKDIANSFDIGLNGSVGLNYRLINKTWLNLDLNYYHGFSDVMKADNLDMKNRNLGLNVGVTFGIGKVRPE